MSKDPITESAVNEQNGEAAPRTPSAETAAPASAEAAATPAVEAGGDAERMQAEIAALKDRELRTRAELENYRKRASRELHDSLQYANLPLLRDLLPILDNIDRAIQAAEQNPEGTGLLEGVKMMRQQVEDLLQQYHCKRIEALHTPFDPNLHHAILQQPSQDFPPNTVVMVTQAGYQLYDRVVRPSQVAVSTSNPS